MIQFRVRYEERAHSSNLHAHKQTLEKSFHIRQKIIAYAIKWNKLLKKLSVFKIRQTLLTRVHDQPLRGRRYGACIPRAISNEPIYAHRCVQHLLSERLRLSA